MRKRYIQPGEPITASWANSLYSPDGNEPIGLDTLLLVEATETFSGRDTLESFGYFSGQAKALGIVDQDNVKYELTNEDVEDQEFKVYSFGFMPLKGQRFLVRFSQQSSKAEAIQTAPNKVYAKVISCRGNDTYPANFYEFGPEADLPDPANFAGYVYQCAYVRTTDVYSTPEYVEDDPDQYFNVISSSSAVSGLSNSQSNLDAGELIPRNHIIVAEQVGNSWVTNWRNPLRVDGMVVGARISAENDSLSPDYYGNVTVDLDQAYSIAGVGYTTFFTPPELYGETIVANNPLKLFSGYEAGTPCLVALNVVTYGGSSQRYKNPFAFFLGGQCCDDC